MRVRIYWNLHQGCWSVQDAKTRRVIGHASQVLVRECEFTVSKAGRERVLREQKKNVHAFVVGELEGAIWTGVADAFAASGWHWDNDRKTNNAYRRAANAMGTRVSYNPYKGDTFFAFTEAGDSFPVHKADMVYLTWENRPGPDLTPKSRVVAFDPCDARCAHLMVEAA